jgi:hypothetical protein
MKIVSKPDSEIIVINGHKVYQICKGRIENKGKVLAFRNGTLFQKLF